MKRYHIVWNNEKTFGIITDDAQLAYEARKSSDANCYYENGENAVTAKAFCDEFGENDCSIQQIEIGNKDDR